jgi:hypothetical protein
MQRVLGFVGLALVFSAIVSACAGDVGPVAPALDAPRKAIVCGGGEQNQMVTPLDSSSLRGLSMGGGLAQGGGLTQSSSGDCYDDYCTTYGYTVEGCNGEECRGDPWHAGWINNLNCDPHDCRNWIGGEAFNCNASEGGLPPQPAAIKIDCGGSTTVTRGESISCEAKPSNGTATVSVTKWNFQPDSQGVLLLTPLATTNPLSGPMVTSGWLVVTGNVGTQTGKMDSVKLEVAARTNFAPGAIPFRVDTVAGPAVANPTLYSDLGNALQEIDAGKGSTAYTQVPSGPNKGLYYFTAIPTFYTAVSANIAPVLPGGMIYQRHETSTRPGGQCSLQQLTTVVPDKIREHEGFNLEQYSHAKVYQTEVQQRASAIRAIAEAWTPNGPVTMTSSYRNKFGAEYLAAATIADDVIRGGTVPAMSPGCVIRLVGM